MRKNVASQVIGAQMVSSSDGSAFTGSVTVYVTGNGGTQAAGSVGSGACTHEGNGFHSYTPAQAETDYDHIAFTFVGTGAIPATVQVFPNFPQSGDTFARLGAPAGASVSADVAAVKAQTAAIETDTQDIQSRIPAALVSGRMDASVGAVASGADFSATMKASINTEADTALSDVGLTTTITGRIDAAVSTRASASDLSTVAGYLDTEIAAILADTNELQTDWANGGRLDLILDARASQSSVDDVPTNAELATALGTADDAVLAQVALVKAVTDKLDDTLEDNGGTFRFSANALEESPSGGGGLTVQDIVDGVWNEAITDHLNSGSTGAALNAAGSAGDPWSTPLPGAYGSGTAGKIVGDTLDASVSSRASQTSVDTVEGIVDSILVDTAEIGAAGAGLTALASAANLSTMAGYVDTEVAAIKAKTDNLPSDPADASDIAALVDALPTAAENATAIWAAGARTLTAIDEDSTTLDMDATIRSALGMSSANLDTQIGDLPTNSELASAIAAGDDAMLSAIAGLPSASDNATAVLGATVEGSVTLVQSIRLANSALGGKASGLDTTNPIYRDLADTKDRIDAVVDADGNRSAVTRDLS